MAPPRNELVVLITGCTEGGIGAALCEEYAAHGAHVFAGVRRPEALGQLTKHERITALRMDVTDDDSVEQAIKSVLDKRGRIDVLVNNAGVNSAGGMSIEVPVEKYRETFEVNVAAHMARRRSGCVVNIGSVAGFANPPFSAAYSTSKAAVHCLSDVMRIELAPLGVHVLCVAPGKIKSHFGDAAMRGITYPASDSPFRGATKAIEARTNYSQVGKNTPASELARAIRRALEAPSWRRRAYLTYGASSSLIWLLYFLPPFLRDGALSRAFRLKMIGDNAQS